MIDGGERFPLLFNNLNELIIIGQGEGEGESSPSVKLRVISSVCCWISTAHLQNPPSSLLVSGIIKKKEKKHSQSQFLSFFQPRQHVMASRRLRKKMKLLEFGNSFVPEDVIIQILLRLPLKSLFRFKAVCQRWHKLISDEYFTQRYNDLSLKNPIVLFKEACFGKNTFACVDRSGCLSEFNLDFLNDDVEVRASCNGLLCCSSNTNPHALYLCNPLTKEFKLLPEINELPREHFVGLIVDPLPQRYNVVMDDEIANNNSHVVVAGSSLYRLTRQPQCIKALHLDKFLWEDIPPPGELNSFTDVIADLISLSESEGSLSLILILGKWMNIWVLQDNPRGAWVLVDKVSLVGVYKYRPFSFRIIQNRDFIFLGAQRRIFGYCRTKRVWKEVYRVRTRAPRNRPLPQWFVCAFPFRSTLCSC